jgi:hypothetical protein
MGIRGVFWELVVNYPALCSLVPFVSTLYLACSINPNI